MKCAIRSRLVELEPRRAPRAQFFHIVSEPNLSRRADTACFRGPHTLVEQWLHGRLSAATRGPPEQNSWSFLPLWRGLRVVWASGGGGGKRLAQSERASALISALFMGGLKRPAGHEDDHFHVYEDLIYAQNNSGPSGIWSVLDPQKSPSLTRK
jgi:hypothetical protein